MGKLYYSTKTESSYDGTFLKAKELNTDLFSQSLHYGNAVFDALRSYHTSLGAHIFKAREHYERLITSADTLGMQLDYSVEELVNITYELLDRNNLQDAYIRPLVFQGANMNLYMNEKPHLFIAAWKWDKYLGKDLVDVKISSQTRPSPRSSFVEFKISGQYVNSIVAATEARNEGYDDALLLDIHGNIAEGTGANFFYEKNGKLYTPPKGAIIPGITRHTVLDICREMGIEVIETEIRPEELREIDGAFFTGTAYQITGIRSLNRFSPRLGWEDSIGFILHEKYGHRVSQNEYADYSII